MSQKNLMQVPRGLRNNNPLNIRKGSVWVGMKHEQKDDSFVQFVSMEYGIRAAFVLLRTYIVNRKLNTIRLIISRWAPSSENDTEAYIANVVKWSGIPDNYILSIYDREIMINLFQAMCRMENGRYLDRSIVVKGYSLI